MAEKNNLKKVFRYWLNKSDNKVHKDVAYVEYKKLNDKQVYVIYDSNHRVLLDMTKSEFDNEMLKRSVGQPIFFHKENDDLALKHFKWAASEKIKAAKEQISKYESVIKYIDDTSSLINEL